MGAGPWTLQMALKVPGTLHFSNQNRRGPIQISHTLTIAIQVERGDDKQMNPKTGQRKRIDVILQLPVHILSVLYLLTFSALINTAYLRVVSETSRWQTRRHSHATPRDQTHRPHHPVHAPLGVVGTLYLSCVTLLRHRV
jgi:hypothetical protein